jgi:nitrite reductase/ring-hydroxylating ferredoxin subunit
MFDLKIRWIKFAETEKDLEKILMGKSCGSARVNNKAVLLVNHENEYYLVKNKCPHQGITLEKASCEEGFIVCPWHRYGFNLKTGRGGGGLHLENYPIAKREDGWYAGFEYLSLF